MGDLFSSEVDIDFDRAAAAFPDISIDGSDDFHTPPHSQAPSISKHEDIGFSFDDFNTTFAPRPQPSAFTSTPILTQTLDEDEPQVIRDWREKQAAEIKARDQASEAKRLETIAKAERAIDAFYNEYAAKTKKNIRENKDQEAEYLAALSSGLSSGTTWERICDLVELQNSQSKTIARTGPGTTDLTRYKEVLLRLKREGESAPGAAGY